jgi:putative peptidoglycan binding protein/caspase domain-containing protein
MDSQVNTNRYFLSAGGRPCRVSERYRDLRIPLRLSDHSTLSGIAVILIAIFIQLVVYHDAQAAGRVALVLACEKYENFKNSAVGVQWAGELGQALKKRNFDVTVAENRNDAETRAVLREFSLKAEGADFALIVVSGHIVTYQSQSFFLPRNAKIQRATDLFSRALSTASIADIGGKAKSAAVLLLMTVPDIPSTLPGIDARPATGGQQAANVVTVFSSSPRVPVSGVDRVSEQAAEKLLAAAEEEPLTLAALVNSISADGLGQVAGKVADLNLSAPLPKAKADDGSRAEMLQAAEAAARAQAEAERKAREASIARDQAEAERKATDKKLREERERARLAEERARDAEQRAKQAQEEASKANEAQPLSQEEAALTWDERREVQRRLQNLRLYRGLVDSIFGDKTREAIREFQKLSGAPETGYLTRAEFERLVQTR